MAHTASEAPGRGSSGRRSTKSTNRGKPHAPNAHDLSADEKVAAIRAYYLQQNKEPLWDDLARMFHASKGTVAKAVKGLKTSKTALFDNRVYNALHGLCQGAWGDGAPATVVAQRVKSTQLRVRAALHRLVAQNRVWRPNHAAWKVVAPADQQRKAARRKSTASPE